MPPTKRCVRMSTCTSVEFATSGGQGQPDPEGRSTTADTAHGDSPTLPFDECATNRQSQTDTGRFHVAGGTPPVKPLEEPRYLVVGNSWASIRHGDHSLASLDRGADPDLTAQGREFDRVVQ